MVKSRACLRSINNFREKTLCFGRTHTERVEITVCKGRTNPLNRSRLGEEEPPGVSFPSSAFSDLQLAFKSLVIMDREGHADNCHAGARRGSFITIPMLLRVVDACACRIARVERTTYDLAN